MFQYSKSKRQKITHYKINGTERLVTRVIAHSPSSSTIPARQSKGRRSKPKPGPRTVTFWVEGTLLANRLDPTRSIPCGEMDSSTPPIPSMDEFTDIFNGLDTPTEVPPGARPTPSLKKVSLLLNDS